MLKTVKVKMAAVNLDIEIQIRAFWGEKHFILICIFWIPYDRGLVETEWSFIHVTVRALSTHTHRRTALHCPYSKSISGIVSGCLPGSGNRARSWGHGFSSRSYTVWGLHDLSSQLLALPLAKALSGAFLTQAL